MSPLPPPAKKHRTTRQRDSLVPHQSIRNKTTHRVKDGAVGARHAHAQVGLGEEGLHVRRHVHADLNI